MEPTSSSIVGRRMKDYQRVPPVYLDDLDSLCSSLEILGILEDLKVRVYKIPMIIRGSSYLLIIFGYLRESLEIFGDLRTSKGVLYPGRLLRSPGSPLEPPEHPSSSTQPIATTESER